MLYCVMLCYVVLWLQVHTEGVAVFACVDNHTSYFLYEDFPFVCHL